MAKIRLAKGRRVPLDTFGYRELWPFVHGWHPPLAGALHHVGGWQTWDQFFADFDSIEDELIERLAAGTVMARLSPGQALPFGSTIRGALQAGECYDAHRHAAYQHSHIYRFRDGHEHAELARLGPAVEVRDVPAGLTDAGFQPPAAAASVKQVVA